jgi:hypothetical protein
MNYTELFTPHHIAVLVDWFAEKPELCVELYHPHGGGSASYFTVRSLAELKSLIQSIAGGKLKSPFGRTTANLNSSQKRHNHLQMR